MEADIWKPVRPSQIIGKARKVDCDGSIHQETKWASDSSQAAKEGALTTTETVASSSARYEALDMSNAAKGVSPVAESCHGLQAPRP